MHVASLGDGATSNNYAALFPPTDREGGEREVESSLQLLAHALATAITDTNDPRVKHHAKNFLTGLP